MSDTRRTSAGRARTKSVVPVGERTSRAHPRGGEILAGNRVRIQHAEITVRRRVGAGVQRARGAGGDVPRRTPVRHRQNRRAGGERRVGTETRAGGGTRVHVGRGWTAGGSREGYGDEEEGRSRSPSSDTPPRRAPSAGESRSGNGKATRAESDSDSDSDSDEYEDDSVPASNLADRRSVSVPRDRSATPGARGDAWSLFDEDPALASASGE